MSYADISDIYEAIPKNMDMDSFGKVIDLISAAHKLGKEQAKRDAVRDLQSAIGYISIGLPEA